MSSDNTEDLIAIVERVKVLQVHAHQIAGMAAACEHALELLVQRNLDYEDEARGIVRDANALGHDRELLRMHADAMLLKVAAGALRKHQDRLTPRALRVLTQLTELGREAAK